MEDDSYPKLDLSLITDHIYLSGKWAIQQSILRDHNITYVVKCIGGSVRASCDTVKEQLVYPMDDRGCSDILEILEEATPELNHIYEKCKADKECMVFHCSAGINRSATLLIAWMMARFNMNLKDAYTVVSKGRPKVCIHDDYMVQLREYDYKLNGTYSTQENELVVTSMAMRAATEMMAAADNGVLI